MDAGTITIICAVLGSTALTAAACKKSFRPTHRKPGGNPASARKASSPASTKPTTAQSTIPSPITATWNS